MTIRAVIKSFILVAGSVFLTAQAASAQQTYRARVLGADYMDGDRCTLTLVDDADQFITEVTDAATCDRAPVGSRILLTREVTEVEILPLPETATVSRAQAGDRACYVGLVDEDNNTYTQLANFEICQQDLVGAKVRLSYEIGNVLAFSCQGDIDCGKSDRAILITQADVIERPTAAQPTIGSLPDGNYRYWDGPATDEIVPSRGLLPAQFVFIFRKRGNNVTGSFAETDGKGICVQGQANENTVTGISVQRFPEASVASAGENFVRFFSSSDRLKVRRGQQLPSNDFLTITTSGQRVPINVIRYNSTLLNLEGLNRINAGTRVPPERCL